MCRCVLMLVRRDVDINRAVYVYLCVCIRPCPSYIPVVAIREGCWRLAGGFNIRTGGGMLRRVATEACVCVCVCVCARAGL